MGTEQNRRCTASSPPRSIQATRPSCCRATRPSTSLACCGSGLATACLCSTDAVTSFLRAEPAAEPSVALTLAQAVLKSDKMDDIVRDAVMLGVAALQPIVTSRTEVTVAALVRSARVDRWKRVALASVKQSRRAVIPEIRTPLSFESWLEERHPADTLMLVEPGASADAESLSAIRDGKIPSEAAIAVGPEGGWAEKEWTAARARGIRLVTLGRRTLRADAVPVAAITVLQYLWGDL